MSAENVVATQLDQRFQTVVFPQGQDYDLLQEINKTRFFQHEVQYETSGLPVRAFIKHRPGTLRVVVQDTAGDRRYTAYRFEGPDYFMGTAGLNTADEVESQESKKELLFKGGAFASFVHFNYGPDRPGEWVNYSQGYRTLGGALESIGWDDGKSEKPFQELKVYFSNSVKGYLGEPEDIGAGLVKYMTSKGADVLSENIAFQDQKAAFQIFKKRTGIDLKKIGHPQEFANVIREADINWVDEAKVLVAVVNGASYGVGMEIQRALDWTYMGVYRKPKPILCLVKEQNLKKLSNMVRGINNEREVAKFELAVYKDLEEAVLILNDFLYIHRRTSNFVER